MISSPLMLPIDAEIKVTDCDKPSFDFHHAAAWVQSAAVLQQQHKHLASSLAASVSGASPVSAAGAASTAGSFCDQGAMASASSVFSGGPAFASAAAAGAGGDQQHQKRRRSSCCPAGLLSLSSSSPATPALSSVLQAPPPPQPRGGRSAAEFNYLFAKMHQAKPPFESTTIGAANRERDRRRIFSRKFGVLPENGSRTAQIFGDDGALLAVGYLRLLFTDDGPYFEVMHNNVNWAVFSSTHTLKGPSRHFHEHIHLGRVKRLKTKAQLMQEKAEARKNWEREVDHRTSSLQFYIDKERTQLEAEERERQRRMLLTNQNSNNDVSSNSKEDDGDPVVEASAALKSASFLAAELEKQQQLDDDLTAELSQLLEADRTVPEPQVVAVLCEQFRDVRNERNPGAGGSRWAVDNFRLDGYADFVPGRLYLAADSVARVVLASLSITPESVLESILGRERGGLQDLQASIRTTINAKANSSAIGEDLAAKMSTNTRAALLRHQQEQRRSSSMESIEIAMRFMGDIEKKRPMDLFRELVGSRFGGEGGGGAVYAMGALLRFVEHDPETVKRFVVYLRVLDASSSKQQQLSERRIQQLVHGATPLFVRCPELATQRWLVDADASSSSSQIGPNGALMPSPHFFDRDEEIERRKRRRGGHFDEWLWQFRGAIAAAILFCQNEHRGRISVVVLAGRGVELCETPKVDPKKKAGEAARKRKEEEENAAMEAMFRRPGAAGAAAGRGGEEDDDETTSASPASTGGGGLTGDPLLDDALEFEEMHKRGGGGGGGFVSRFSSAIRAAGGGGGGGGGAKNTNESSSSPIPSSPAAAAAAKRRNELQQRQQILALRRQRLASRRSKPVVDEADRPFRFFVSFDDTVVQFLTDCAKKENILNESTKLPEIGNAVWDCTAGPTRPLISPLLLQSIFSIEWVSADAFLACVSRNQGSFDLGSLENLMMSNIQREKKMLEKQQRQHLKSQLLKPAAAATTNNDSDDTSSVLPPTTCPRFCARKWFWYCTPMIISGEQQARLLQTPNSKEEFPARLKFPSWWSFTFLDGIQAKSLRERLHAQVAAKVKPAAAELRAQQEHKKHSLAARTGTSELTFVQKRMQQRRNKLSVVGEEQQQQQQAAGGEAVEEEEEEEEEEDAHLSPAAKRLKRSKVSAEEDLSPYTGLEEFFADGTYQKDSEFSQQLMMKRSRALSAATRLALGISGTTVLLPKQLLKHLEKSRAQAVFERQLREQQEEEERQREAEEDQEVDEEEGEEKNDEGDGSDASGSSSIASAPFSSFDQRDESAADVKKQQQQDKKRRGSSIDEETRQRRRSSTLPPPPSTREDRIPSLAMSSSAAGPSACFVFTVTDTSSAAGGTTTSFGMAAGSSAAAEAAASCASGEIIGFCKGSVELVSSASCVPPERLQPYIGAAAGSATSSSPSAWIVLRVDSLLVGERRVHASTLERNMRALAEREEEERKAAADPFYVPKFSSITGGDGDDADGGFDAASLRKKPFARMDLALFILKALFETFRAGDGASAEHVCLVATVDHAEEGEDAERRSRIDLAQAQLAEQFGLRSLSRSKRFWKDALGCTSFAPPVMKTESNVDAPTAEVVFHMFSE